MTEAAVARHRPPETRGTLREMDARGVTAARTDDLVSQLTHYLPTELVAAYTAVAGLMPTLDGSRDLCGSDFTPRWIALAVFAVLTPVAVQATYTYKRRSAGSIGPRVPWFEAGTAVVAFGAWAIILPLAPVFTWCWWEPQYGAIVGITTLFVLGLLGRLLAPSRPA